MAPFHQVLPVLDTGVAGEYEVLRLRRQLESALIDSCSRILGMRRCSMDIDQEKLEHTVLALLYLTSFKDRFGVRAWKGHDWDVMNLLHEKGYISNPATKAKSVAFTEEGARLSKELFEKLFAK
jgi:Domain of unknown function (DUF6429)